MSSSTAPFSFHCVICIEPFNDTDRPPVVLPCGHTFICELCSKRIKRCFECRTSLFITRPPTTNGGHSNSNYNANSQGFNGGFQNNSYCDSPVTPGSRRTGGYQGHTRYMNNSVSQSQSHSYGSYGGHAYNSTPNSKKAEQIPLPLPKNHVLLELMHSAQTRNKVSQNNPMADTNATVFNVLDNNNGGANKIEQVKHEFNNEDDDDDEAVLNSLDELSSSCGTYIVKDRYGLPVYSVDDINCRDPCFDERFNPSSKPTMMLSHGQKIQVVAVEDGMFYLARNTGVVFANSVQLVKVGVAKERSCQIEGMINAAQTSKALLSQKLNDVIYAEANLRSELDCALSRPPDHPIIEDSFETQAKKMEEDLFAHTTISSSVSTGMMDVEVCSTNSSNSHVHIQMQGQPQARSPSESGGYLSSSFSAAARTQVVELPDGHTQILSDESISTPTPATPPPVETPKTRRTFFFDTTTPTGHVSEPDSPFRSGLMCGSSIFPLLRRLDDDDDDDARTHIPIRRSDSDDFPSSIFDAVDFRTGMSGHIALNRAHRKYGKHVSRGNVRMMGEHRGIAAIKNIRKIRTPSSPLNESKNCS